jgi:hypothetical protein
MTVFPTTAVSDFTSAFTGVISANIAVVLGILALVFGIKFVMRLFNKSTKGHL